MVSITSASSDEPLRLVIVEDHEMFRGAVQSYCEDMIGCRVVGTADNATSAIETVLANDPDVLLLDLMLRVGDGFQVIEQIAVQRPAVRIVVLTSYCDPYTMHRLTHAGIAGYVDKKEESLPAVGEAIRAAAQGTNYFSPSYHVARNARRADPESFVKLLSEWEQRILTLIGQSLSDEEIAAMLGIAPRTASTHRSMILRKLGLPNTPKLIDYAIRQGFAHRSEWRNC